MKNGIIKINNVVQKPTISSNVKTKWLCENFKFIENL